MTPTMTKNMFEGFVKASAESGVPQEQVAVLFKLATWLQIRSARPDDFDQGAASVSQKQAQDLVPEAASTLKGFAQTSKPIARQAATAARGGLRFGKLGILAALAAGGATAIGGKNAITDVGNRIAEDRDAASRDRYRQAYNQQQTKRELTEALPGMRPPNRYAGLMGLTGPFQTF